MALSCHVHSTFSSLAKQLPLPSRQKGGTTGLQKQAFSQVMCLSNNAEISWNKIFFKVFTDKFVELSIDKYLIMVIV